MPCRGISQDSAILEVADGVETSARRDLLLALFRPDKSERSGQIRWKILHSFLVLFPFLLTISLIDRRQKAKLSNKALTRQK